MIPSAVNLRITQEIPNLPSSRQTKWYWQNLEDKPISTQGFYLASLLQRNLDIRPICYRRSRRLNNTANAGFLRNYELDRGDFRCWNATKLVGCPDLPDPAETFHLRGIQSRRWRAWPNHPTGSSLNAPEQRQAFLRDQNMWRCDCPAPRGYESYAIARADYG